MMSRLRTLVLFALLGLTGAAQAAGYTGPFVITSLWISGAENQHVRVSGFPAMTGACPRGSTWLYINQSASGSKEYMAALMLAYGTGKPVNIYWQEDGNGYCQIIEMGV